MRATSASASYGRRRDIPDNGASSSLLSAKNQPVIAEYLAQVDRNIAGVLPGAGSTTRFDICVP
jgi:hypothetical protein